MSRTFSPTTPAALPALVADFAAGCRPGHPTRLALDGPDAAEPVRLAGAVAEVLRSSGRPATVIAAAAYWRDSSLRLENGRTDVDSYAYDWLDARALTREVFAPLGPGGSGAFLPALRDPSTNRSARSEYRRAGPDEVVIVAGELLLGHGLDFDVAVHLALSPSARRRRTDPDRAWTLPAHDRYDADVGPDSVADLVVRWDDPLRPAIGRSQSGPAQRTDT